MKYRRRMMCLGMAVATLAACGAQDPQAKKANGSAKPIPVQAVLRRLSEIAGQANGAAPAEVDPDTRLDGAKAGPGLRLTITYTLVNAEANGVNSTSFETKLASTIKKGSCENTDLRPVIDQGVVVVLEYRGNQGNTIGTVSVDRAACGALK